MPNDLKILFEKHLSQTASQQQTEQLMELLKDPANDQLFRELMEKTWSDYAVDRPFFSGEESGSMLHAILGEGAATQRINQAPRVHFLRRGWFRYAAAAVIVVALAAVVYLFTNTGRHDQPLVDQKPSATDVGPGGQKAILTLSDGSTINLDNAANGNLTEQGNTQVKKMENGQIAYQLKGSAAVDVMWNTMRTPAGGHYQVILADGTKVWLNAGSSITYPTAFPGNKRAVKISGEVYFEVAHNKQKPFVVNVDGRSTVEVLGTSFNVNAYDNEIDIRTTLVEGRVWIDSAVILQPHQQAVKRNPAPVAVLSDFDMDQALAWKNGLFNFNGMDLRAVMRQLERWYDIKVRYQAPVDNGLFRGKIYRNANLSEVLDILQKVGGTRFRLERKTLIVL